MAALSTIAAISAIAASVFSAGSALTQKPPKAPELPTTPVAPSVDATAIEKTLSQKKSKAAVPGTPTGRSSTLLTGPAGSNAPAPTEQKTLLGL